jgi:hypothetical protein
MNAGNDQAHPLPQVVLTFASIQGYLNLLGLRKVSGTMAELQLFFL